jgi:sugar phosphate isomerase/epimerase
MKLAAWVFLHDILSEKAGIVDKLAKKNLFKDNSIRYVINKLKEAGVNGMELLIPSNVSDEDIFMMQRIVKRNAFPVLSIHQSLKFFSKISFREIKKLFKIAKIFGAKIIVLHLRSLNTSLFSSEQIGQLHLLEESCNIRIGFENSEKNMLTLVDVHTWKEKEFANLMKKIDFNITFDTTHLGQTGGDIISFFKDNKERIINIHLSDYKKHKIRSSLHPLKYTHLPLGEGDLPIMNLLQTLKKDNYDGLITLEVNSYLPDVCESAKFVRKYY